MDAVKFIEERNRMCMACHRCVGCKAYDEDSDYCRVDIESSEKPDGQVSIVEQWAKEHPRKTRQSVFLEQYPEVEIDECGHLQLCPKRISADCRSRYRDCANRVCKDCRREFWMQEVE